MERKCNVSWLAALSVFVLCLLGFASTRASLAYTPYKLFELALQSDIVVYGRITALQAETFDLECERAIVGVQAPSILRVKRFVDWTCASRWSEYAVGQPVMLFLGKPDADSAYPWIQSGGGEGEMPLLGEDVVARGYRVRGYDDGPHDVSGGSVWGTRMPLAEFCTAIEGLRSVLRDELLPAGYDELAHFISPAVSEQELAAFEKTSRCARHLLDSARSYERWSGPRPPIDVRLDPKKLRELQFAPGVDRTFANVLGLAECAAFVGDIDGDGHGDIAVDTPAYTDVTPRARQLRLLFLDAAGNVRAHRALQAKSRAVSEWSYARALAAVGDLDGNGTMDLVAGKPDWDRPKSSGSDAAKGRGGVWVLLLGPGGSLEKSVDIGSSPLLADLGVSAGAGLGSALAPLGDLDGDGTLELAVGQDPSFDYEKEHGCCVFLLSLHRDGTLARARRVDGRAFESPVRGSIFGARLARAGDIDGDGVEDLAFSNPGDSDGGSSRGAVWILFLERSGQVRATQKISDWEGGFEGLLHDSASFGRSLASAGDLDGNGVPDLLVGSDEGLWTLMLDKTGRVRSHRKLEQTRREDVSVSFNRFLCVLPGSDADGSKDFFCGGSAGLWNPTQPRFWALRIGRDGGVRER